MPTYHASSGLSDDEETTRDDAYAERDMVVALLARMAFAHGVPVWIFTDPDADPGWQNVVYIHLPTGQVSWHVQDHELQWLEGLHRIAVTSWDGHTTETKYSRVMRAYSRSL